MARRRTNSDAFSLFSFQDIITSVTGIVILITLLLAVELSQNQTVRSAEDSHSDIKAESELKQLDRQIESLKAILNDGKAFVDLVASTPESELLRAEQQLKGQIAALKVTVDQLRLDEQSVETARDATVAMTTAISDKQLAALREKIEHREKQLKAIKSSNRIIYNSDSKSAKTAWLVDLMADRIRVGKPGERECLGEFAADDLFMKWANQRNQQSEYFVLLVRPESIELYGRLFELLKDSGFQLGFDLLGEDAVVLDADESTGVLP